MNTTRISRRSWPLLILALLAVACGDGPKAGVDGKTSWLGVCEHDSDCKAGLTCACSICTRVCSTSTDCGKLGSNATCAEPARLSLTCGGDAPGERLCIATCKATADCTAGHVCVDGACSVGVSGDGGQPVRVPPRMDAGTSPRDSGELPDDASVFPDASVSPDANTPDAEPPPGSVDGGPSVPDARPPPGGCPDDDGDGVCNALDVCPGFDDRVDSDGDGRPDGCEPDLLIDLNTSTADSSPDMFTVFGGAAYFIASDGIASAAQLWKTDATAATASSAKIPGLSGATGVFPLATVGDKLFLLVRDSSSSSLWVTDGTASGTHVVKSGIAYANPSKVVGGLLYFVTGYGTESLWRSDGTDAGTFAVVTPTQTTRAITIAGNYRDKWLDDGAILYFTDGESGEVWRTDGSVAGTFALTSFGSSGGASGAYMSMGEFAALHGRVYFVVSRGNLSEVWSTDGTVGGTHPAFDKVPAGFLPGGVAATPTRLFVSSAQVPPSGTSVLWTSPGDGDPPVLVESGPGTIMSMVTAGGLVYLLDSGRIWRSDGTAVGTVPIPVEDYLARGGPQKLLAGATGVYFPYAHAGNATPERLYRIDATGATSLTGDLKLPNTLSLDASKWALSGDRLFFVATTPAHGAEPWISDGTAAGTHEIADINSLTLSSGASDFAAGSSPDGPIVFLAQQGIGNQPQPFITRGTAASTRPLLTSTGETLFGAERWLTLGDQHFFVAQDPQSSTIDVYRVEASDQLSKIHGPPNGNLAFGPAFLGGSRVYFGDDLYADSIPAATLTGSAPTLSPSDGSLLQVVPSEWSPKAVLDWNGATYLIAGPRYSQGTLYRIDGVASPTPLGGASTLVSTSTSLYFDDFDGQQTHTLYTSDGTQSGTRPVLPAVLGSFGLHDITFQGNVYFGEGQSKLFRTDGTVTTAVADMNGVAGGGTVGNRLVVVDFEGGVWTTDAATSPLTRLPKPDAAPRSITGAAVYRGILYFPGYDAEHGVELWRTDGTVAGTFMEADINPGAADSLPHDFHATQNALYFTATRQDTGDEPFIMRY